MSFVGIFCSAIFSETASAQSGIISPAENGIDFFLLLKSSFFKCLQNSATALMLGAFGKGEARHEFQRVGAADGQAR